MVGNPSFEGHFAVLVLAPLLAQLGYPALATTA